MCLLLVDAMVWNYIGKAKALPGFLASLSAIPVTLIEVVDQLKPALCRWPELSEIITAVERADIQTIDLSEAEEEQRIRFLARLPGLGPVDCGLLAVAMLRKWKLLTCERVMLKVAAREGIDTVEVESLLDQGVEYGFLSVEDRSWILAYSNGNTGHRES